MMPLFLAAFRIFSIVAGFWGPKTLMYSAATPETIGVA